MCDLTVPTTDLLHTCCVPGILLNMDKHLNSYCHHGTIATVSPILLMKSLRFHIFMQ